MNRPNAPRRMQPLSLRFEHGTGRTVRHTAHRLGIWIGGHGPRRQCALASAVLALGLGLLGASAWHAIDLRYRLDAAQAAQRAQARAPRPIPTPVASAPSRAQLVVWTQAVQALNWPWPALLDALERHTPADVALIALEPPSRTGRLRLVAEARTLAALQAYAATLQDSTGIESAFVLRHETREQDTARPVRATIELAFPSMPTGNPR